MDDAVPLRPNRRLSSRSRTDAVGVPAATDSRPNVISRDEFAALYAEWVGPIFRYCRLRLGDREEAEDATSAVFVRALRGLDGYRGGSFPAWLFAIARRVVADAARPRAHAPIESAVDLPDAAPGPEDVALALDAVATIERLLEPLTEDQRTVVELRVAGLAGAEIAQVLGRSEAAVKMLQLRAVQRMRATRDLEGRRGGG